MPTPRIPEETAISDGSAPIHLRNAEPGPRMVEDVKPSNPKHPRWGSKVVTVNANNLPDVEDVINGVAAATPMAMDWEGTINLTLPLPEPVPITVKLPSSRPTSAPGGAGQDMAEVVDF
ncbi:hypothetical protein DACRYDRAFT_104042 [Dacryopinax primogenitus]|uniref:Uncharacterized protein n=1 Tax=Dacryopinax primogenitus (strain DJM 731) TaxID=1858805 RepID=M5G5L8_DACPD|nr:uncharacterized protein DACRYDRAFT_104042 [Dacryopinax primogenitus]EJU05556.1 hypothetical protein DACRYDRAFT_104042 [Dacryopinax primogenitus]